MENESQDKIAEFCSVTGADPERADFFLRAAAWNVELALSTYFENEGDAGTTGAAARSADEDELPEPVSNPSTNPTPAQPGSSSSRIQTFSSWGGSSRHEKKEDSDDDDQGQAYFAGGSETSGQQILGPPRKNDKKGRNLVSDLFKAAKEHGAEVRSEPGTSEEAPRTHFTGTGYRLGESEAEVSQSVRGVTVKKDFAVVLRLWKTGFTVNDEPLRPFNEPQNREFLNSIYRGEIPEELVRLAEGGKVALDMEDHSSEDYVPPKQPKVRAFTGTGQTLSSQESQASTSNAVSATAAQAVTVDSSQPVTNVQVRLADGSRLVCKFNHSHTVGDVRRHIAASRPQYSGVAFSLITTLPSRQLTDDSVTLKDADLLNAAIMQKL